MTIERITMAPLSLDQARTLSVLLAAASVDPAVARQTRVWAATAAARLVEATVHAGVGRPTSIELPPVPPSP